MQTKVVRRWLLAGVVILAGCELDRTNPNAPTEGDVLSSREGIVALTVGLQGRFGAGMDDFMYPGGLITDELGAPTGALASYKDVETGAAIVNTYDAVEGPWQAHYRTIKTANDLIAFAPRVTLGDSTLSGILTIAYLFKAMSLGNLVQMYEQVPINTYDVTAPTFVNRTAALTYVLALLDTALAQYRVVRPGSEFNTSIRAAGFDVENTIYAMQARYQRIAGDHSAALAAAGLVNLAVLSVMPFSDQAINPIHDLSNRAGYVKPRDTLRLTAEAGDGRAAYHVTVAAITGNVRPLDNFAQYSSNSSPIPFYYPGEMRLIQAEALVTLGDIPGARAAVNGVRTKCGGTLNEPKACLAALADTLLDTAPELLAEIYRQRKFELFATGLRWEDTRRMANLGLGRLYNRCWLLYPNSERSTNANTPSSDPEQLPATCP